MVAAAITSISMERDIVVVDVVLLLVVVRALLLLLHVSSIVSSRVGERTTRRAVLLSLVESMRAGG
jgi:hypothetical protein